MYANLANELKKNTDIMEMTFKKFNLRVLQYSYHPYSDEDADCEDPVFWSGAGKEGAGRDEESQSQIGLSVRYGEKSGEIVQEE